MTLDDIYEVIHLVSYPDTCFDVWEERGRPLLQVAFNAPDSETGHLCLQRGRKWCLSYHMTRSEIVTTALKAILTSVEHEAREQFHYNGQPIFGPHFDVDVLLNAVEQGDHEDVRADGAWVAAG